MRPVSVSLGSHGRESGERLLAGETHMPVPGWRLRSGYFSQYLHQTFGTWVLSTAHHPKHQSTATGVACMLRLSRRCARGHRDARTVQKPLYAGKGNPGQTSTFCGRF